MAVNPSRTKMPFDKSAATLLRDPAATARSASAIDTSISLSELRTAYWHNFEIPHGVMRIGCAVSDGQFQGSTYTIAIIVDDVAAMNNSPTTVGGAWPITSVGFYEFDIDSKSIPQLDTVHAGVGKFIATSLVVAGTPVAITGAVNNGSGKVRLTVVSTAGFVTGQTRTISGIVGTVEANTTTTITVVSATQIDLLLITFTNAYTSGGTFSAQISFGAWIGKSTDA